MLTARHKIILTDLIESYIKKARPISSQLLARMGNLKFSPATIRNDLAALARQGYIEQPHTSAGRIPTNRGYRYYLDELMEPQVVDKTTSKALNKIIEEYHKDKSALLHALAHFITQTAHSFVFGELVETEQQVTVGFSELAHQPEFQEAEALQQIAKVIDRLEQNWQKLYDEFETSDEAVSRVFIGEEHPLFERNISSIVAQYRFPTGGTTLLTILGPKRMDYRFNLGLLNMINEIFEIYER